MSEKEIEKGASDDKTSWAGILLAVLIYGSTWIWAFFYW